ncbi:hypothetical protein A3731_07810 [Roseovarius sp. HI0049]|nr:hypothetical protein A3731_36925 [Roseovarius sp. HI0049]KZY47589.1 hypothetical protein A3731_07810 [Roseovarius sp. HI0049]
MRRRTFQYGTPAAFDAHKYLVAWTRAQRRAALWHAARLTCPDHQSFIANAHSIELDVHAQLEREGLA